MADIVATKRYVCLSCGGPIEVRPDAPLGTPYYRHVDPVVFSSHMPVRSPENGRA